MTVLVKGAGVAGLCAAHALWSAGLDVAVLAPPGQAPASWYAGGMLAPYCEGESAEQMVVDLGLRAADWWDTALPGSVVRKGTLVVAPARDIGELARFATRTSGFEPLDGEAIAALEPDLAGHFRKGLFFKDEAHLDPRQVLTALTAKLQASGVPFESDADGMDLSGFEWIVDCTGSFAKDAALRGVRGEMLVLHSADVSLARPVRLIHPRFPVYVVPREGRNFMVGATMLESDARGPITARSMMELLNAAYGVHPAFGEAAIVETGTGIRPAYPDNLPRINRSGRTISVNGLYRHGFLLAPAMAERAAAMISRQGAKAG
ncbi:MAG: glycine oxidase ThiO [Phyllobacterium sp.]